MILPAILTLTAIYFTGVLAVYLMTSGAAFALRDDPEEASRIARRVAWVWPYWVVAAWLGDPLPPEDLDDFLNRQF